MSRGIASITWRPLRAGEHVWPTSFGTKQNWLNNCMTFILWIKKAMTLKLGLSIVKIENSKKCDIFTTSLLYSGDLTP